jgi:hypothetical protein
MAIIKDAIKDMESMMKPETVRKVHREVKRELFFIRIIYWFKYIKFRWMINH